MNHRIPAWVSHGPSFCASYDGEPPRASVTGYTRSWKRKGIVPACVTTAARFAPAESPPIASRSGSQPSASACAHAHSAAVNASSRPAGNGCSGASR